MHLFGMLGMLLILVGVIIGGYLSIIRLFYGVSISDRPLLLLAVLLMVFGAQFLVLGIIGEMLARIRLESGKKPPYDIITKLNLD